MAQLEQAQRDVLEGEEKLSRQKELIQVLKHGGHDIAVATEILRAFEMSQRCSVADRDNLLKQMAAAV